MALKPCRAVRMQLNADVELRFLATRHVVEWRPTAATVPPNFYLGMIGYYPAATSDTRRVFGYPN